MCIAALWLTQANTGSGWTSTTTLAAQTSVCTRALCTDPGSQNEVLPVLEGKIPSVGEMDRGLGRGGGCHFLFAGFLGWKEGERESSAFLHVVWVQQTLPQLLFLSQPWGHLGVSLALGIPPCPSSLELSWTWLWTSLPGCPVRLDSKTVG